MGAITSANDLAHLPAGRGELHVLETLPAPPVRCRAWFGGARSVRRESLLPEHSTQARPAVPLPSTLTPSLRQTRAHSVLRLRLAGAVRAGTPTSARRTPARMSAGTPTPCAAIRPAPAR